MQVDVDLVNKIGQEIWDWLDKRSGGRPDDAALREIARLTQQAQMASGYDSYISEKCGSINSFSKILYSARKHKRYDDRNESGSERVRGFVRADAYRLKTWDGHDWPRE